MPDQQYFLQCSLQVLGKTIMAEEALRLASPTVDAKLTQQLQPPEGLPPVRILQYLSRAALEQNVVEDTMQRGRPAIELEIAGPSQTFARWLVADRSNRNRLTSFIGTWRYMAVDTAAERDLLYDQFKTEFTRDPVLIVRPTNGGPAREIAARPGTKHAMKELGCTIHIKEFFPHFAIDDHTNMPLNRSQRRKNPAALVEVEHGDTKSQRWHFARFPDYGDEGDSALPVRITLDCPMQADGKTPDFVLVTTRRKDHVVWTRADGEVSERTLAEGDTVPIAGSQYAFAVRRFIPSGRLVEKYVPANHRDAVPVLQIETTDADGKPTALWMTVGNPRIVQTAKGPLTITFGPRRNKPTGAHK